MSDTAPEELDPRLLALSSLLQVESEARKAESLRDLQYIIVNDTHRVIGYRQAVVWSQVAGEGARIEQASHVSELERNAPHVRWLSAVATFLAASPPAQPATLLATDLPEDLRAGWTEHLAPYGLLVPLRAPDGSCPGGLLLVADAPWNEGQVLLAGMLADAYGHAWQALRPAETPQKVRRHLRQHWRRYALGAVVLLLLPVRQYTLAPAEVVAVDPVVVAAPMDGVVASIEVAPNEQVTAGTLLFTLEDTGLVNEVVVAQKAYEVAEAEYLKNAQKAFECDVCRGKVPELQAGLEKEAAEVAWRRERLERSRVVATADGVALFNDPNEWRGRPVSVGERVMLLASPQRTRLRIDLPIADAIAIEPGTEVVFYLNVNPLDSYDGTITRTSYEAYSQPDNSLAYLLMADFGSEAPRLGLRGTAKVYGARAPLVFHILRRPAAWLRRTLGV